MTTLVLADSNSGNLSSLCLRLRTKRPDWQISTLSSGQQVVKHINVNEVDCVVSESKLSDMSGLDLLREVQLQNVKAIRFVMALNTGDDVKLDTEQAKHNLIYRATTDDELISSIETSLRLRTLLDADALNHFIAKIDTLPSLPDIYQELVAELGSPQSSLIRVAQIIETDVGLTATVMKVVNSSFYGLNRQVESVSQAVTLLGAHLIKNITLTSKVFSQFEGGAVAVKKLRLLNDQANKTGALANHFARLARLPKTVVDHTQISGMLGNCGTLLAMGQSVADITKYQQIQHELLGAYLLRSWQMPDCVVEAVAMQHGPLPHKQAAVTPLIILHAIRYLEAIALDFSNGDQWQNSCDYLGQLVSHELACEWLEAYRDLQQLTSHTDLNGSHAA